ncbi:transmembrane protein 132C-like [Erpetoichthys calabaricus]|uniref:transmembrane protein 132C-like n=1 Tax=Erpetoichthys calabaricus TaxID=27687 RepID=UPI002234E7E1|nr:transmembrane protein 132C-like [Erpetoichthys calabaricus]
MRWDKGIWRMAKLYTAVILTTTVTVCQDLDSGELSDSQKRSTSFPMHLPVNYEIVNAGFSCFLKEANQEIMRNSSMQSHTEAFIILEANQSPTVNASYGTLSTQQVVPLELMQTADLFHEASKFTFNWKIQPYILNRRVHYSQPKVYILFYISGKNWADPQADNSMDNLPCIMVFAFWQTQEVRSSCRLKGHLGLCVAELEPNPTWFHPSEPSGRDKRAEELDGTPVELYYMAQSSENRECSMEESKKGLRTKQHEQYVEMPFTPMQRIGNVRLYNTPTNEDQLSELWLGESIVIQMPSKSIMKLGIATYYVSIASSSAIDRFTLRAKGKKGVFFRKMRVSNDPVWEVTPEAGNVGRSGTVTFSCQRQSLTLEDRSPEGLLEIMQLDFATEEFSIIQTITWQVEYPGTSQTGEEGLTRVNITQRETIGLAPLAMDTAILNTAILTGKKVTLPVKVLKVERGGIVTDVSDLTDCQSTDEDILKVSDRCDFIYVNGKEMKGRVKTAVNFTHEGMSAQLEVTVWVPRLPLQIEVSDTELSQIKGWRIPITTSKRSSWDSDDEEEDDKRGRGCTLQYQHGIVRVLTHFVAEQADPRDQLAYFLSSDWQLDITDMVRYFIKVEDPRIARLQNGKVIVGRELGVTTLQVLSPLSDSILAEKTVTVRDDKVMITELGIQLVTELSLSLQLSPGSSRAILATTTTQELFHRSKQEAMMSAWIQFNDGSITPLDIYDPNYYLLSVASLDEEVISVRNDPQLKIPFIMAEGEGQGVLLKVEMVICEVCQKSKRKSVLAVGSGSLKVKFHQDEKKTKITGSTDYGNDGEELENINTDQKQKINGQSQTGADVLFYGSPILDREESAIRKVTTTVKTVSRDLVGGSLSGSSPQDPINLIDYTNFPSQLDLPKKNGALEENDLAQTPRFLSDLEIGMYALLGVFCLAILVFLLNCASYVLKYRHKQTSLQGQENLSHLHDWVWLGTDAELVMNMAGSPPLHNKHKTTIIDIGLGLENGANLISEALENENGPTLHPTGSLTLKTKNDSINSPTTKRKRVKFTTFTSVSLDGERPTSDFRLLEREDEKWVSQSAQSGNSKDNREQL